MKIDASKESTMMKRPRENVWNFTLIARLAQNEVPQLEGSIWIFMTIKLDRCAWRLPNIVSELAYEGSNYVMWNTIPPTRYSSEVWGITKLLSERREQRIQILYLWLVYEAFYANSTGGWPSPSQIRFVIFYNMFPTENGILISFSIFFVHRCWVIIF